LPRSRPAPTVRSSRSATCSAGSATRSTQRARTSGYRARSRPCVSGWERRTPPRATPASYELWSSSEARTAFREAPTRLRRA
jgi:hypothetical protein